MRVTRSLPASLTGDEKDWEAFVGFSNGKLAYDELTSAYKANLASFPVKPPSEVTVTSAVNVSSSPCPDRS